MTVLKPIQSALETAREAWGEDMPDWIAVLAAEAVRTSQAAVAKRLDRSGAVVSQVLRRTYAADYQRIEERVRGVLMAGQVTCPGLGEIPLQACQDWRAKASTFALGNPTRVRMFHACNRCPRHKPTSTPEDDA